LTLDIRMSEPQFLQAWRSATQDSKSLARPLSIRITRVMLLVLVVAVPAFLPRQTWSQALSFPSESSSGTAASTVAGALDLTYVRPKQRTMVHNYMFEAFGPYPIVGAATAAGINQLSNSPPEWHQGLKGYSRRFGSDFAIAAIGTTTRFGLAEAFKEDTLYYRCECKGLFPRLGHAVISTVTTRRGEDGHRAFSFPALIAPYAGSMAAVYGWYPDRYGAKDAFRMGNYSLLGYFGGNVALEFLHRGPHSLLSRLHLNNAHGAPGQGPNQ
jgi:hypothetical protein